MFPLRSEDAVHDWNVLVRQISRHTDDQDPRGEGYALDMCALVVREPGQRVIEPRVDWGVPQDGFRNVGER